jgi:colanic acid/amylovoran biosynthesis glycosyltransferase
LPTIAYITNQFPSPVEWYVIEEIRELRRAGLEVVPCSSRRVDESILPRDLGEIDCETLFLQPLQWRAMAKALWMCCSRFSAIADLLAELVLSREPALRRIKTLLHTWLGAYYAVRLTGRDVEHIHVHHGYFSSWIALVAARLLDIRFSMTLHGSDLLVHASYMETKLRECAFCLTISEFNRRHILAHYPEIAGQKVLVQRLGVEIPVQTTPRNELPSRRLPVLLAVGRLHPVKNYTFLLQACCRLRRAGMQFRCVIVGEGPERAKLENLIRKWNIADSVMLVGHVPRSKIDRYYERADLVVLTSHSEGIPLVLMEAMARSKIVLAPSITGIPELVVDGRTGFLYTPGNPDEFVERVKQICGSLNTLQTVQSNARAHVRRHFNQRTNLESFAETFRQKITPSDGSCCDENFVLQQV